MTTKEKILFSTMKLISKRGLSKLSIKSIADEVHISQAAIYRYFPSKLELIKSVLEFVKDKFLQIYNDSEVFIEDPEKQLSYLLENIFQFLYENKSLIRPILLEYMYYEDNKFSDILQEYFKLTLYKLSSIIKRGKEKGIFINVVDSDISALFIRGFLPSLFLFSDIKGQKDYLLKEKNIFLQQIFKFLKGGSRHI